MDSYEQLVKTLKELSYITSTLAILEWDEQVYMPVQGAKVRGETKAYLAGMLHQKFTSNDFAKQLKAVKALAESGKLNDKQLAIYKEIDRQYQRQKKLPLEYVQEISKVTSEAHHKWAEARQKSDYKIFLPYLKKIVELKKQEANYVGYEGSPYDALLDAYEPGLTAAQLDQIFAPIKDFLIPFIKKIKQSKNKFNSRTIISKYPIDQQAAFLKILSEKMGFDYQKGRLDTSAHPFSTSFHPEDVRITTRFDEQDVLSAITSTIHEMGHGFYEAGLPVEHFGTPLAESISLGIHESQSRVWENQIGRSLSFWKYFYPLLKKQFPKPFKLIPLRDFYRAVNNVRNSLIRVESDEVTYNLHIIIRYELERDLMEGKVKVEDLPKLWNQKIQQYLGLKVAKDSNGVLQDVHWSGGAIGYFPTYSLGNLYSAQFYRAARKALSKLDQQLESGNFKDFREWLRKNIHQHGKLYSAEELVKKVTGESLNSKYFIEYIKDKYSKIYNLK